MRPRVRSSSRIRSAAPSLLGARPCRRGLTCRLEDLVAPGVVEGLGDVVLSADVANRTISPQPGEDDLQLLLGREFAVLALLCQLDFRGRRAAILRLASDAFVGASPAGVGSRPPSTHRGLLKGVRSDGYAAEDSWAFRAANSAIRFSAPSFFSRFAIPERIPRRAVASPGGNWVAISPRPASILPVGVVSSGC